MGCWGGAKERAPIQTCMPVGYIEPEDGFAWLVQSAEFRLELERILAEQ